MKYLCVNAGSSSLKFMVFEMPEEKVIISGYIEKIGLKDSFWNTKINGEKIRGEKYLKTHAEAVEVLIDELLKHKAVSSLNEIKGVGHRVLHGGEKYSDSVIITDEVIEDIKDLTKLGPLHHPGNLAGIEAMKKLQKQNNFKSTATNSMAMLIVINTASLQLIPTLLCTLRQKHGCANPMEIIPHLWIISAVSLIAGITSAKILEKVK